MEVKDRLRKEGYSPGNKVTCKCTDDDEAWEAVVKADQNGRLYLCAGLITYYPDASDELQKK